MRLRKEYVPAYVKCLHANEMGGNDEIAAMDADLPEQTILVFRRLAHAKVHNTAHFCACRSSSIIPSRVTPLRELPRRLKGFLGGRLRRRSGVLRPWRLLSTTRRSKTRAGWAGCGVVAAATSPAPTPSRMNVPTSQRPSTASSTSWFQSKRLPSSKVCSRPHVCGICSAKVGEQAEPKLEG